jgi:hypothetical protein
MGANTTEGTGAGAADSKKRNDRMPLEINRLIGVRLSQAGSVKLNQHGFKTVEMQALGPASEYIVMLTQTTNQLAYLSQNLISINNNWIFTINGEENSIVNYCIIKI